MDGKEVVIESTLIPISYQVVAVENFNHSSNCGFDTVSITKERKTNNITCKDEYGCWFKNVLRFVILNVKKFYKNSCDLHGLEHCFEFY